MHCKTANVLQFSVVRSNRVLNLMTKDPTNFYLYILNILKLILKKKCISEKWEEKMFLVQCITHSYYAVFGSNHKPMHDQWWLHNQDIRSHLWHEKPFNPAFECLEQVRIVRYSFYFQNMTHISETQTRNQLFSVW